MDRKYLKSKAFVACMLMFLLSFPAFLFSGCNANNYAKKLHKAIDNDDLSKLTQLLKEDGDINSRPALVNPKFFESNNMPALLYACWLGKFDAVQLLLEYGADPNIETKNESALMLCTYNAAASEEEKMLLAMETLIQKGADVNYRNANSISVLSTTTLHLQLIKDKYSGKVVYSVLKLLVDSGADFEKALSGGKSMLLFDFSYKNDDFIEYLINEKHAEINIADDSDNSPLIFAAKMGSSKSVEILLRYDANKEHRNVFGKSALDYARENDYTEIVMLLS